jgi:hypothetical protein
MRKKTTQPIEWHERCLENLKVSLHRDLELALSWAFEAWKAQESANRTVKAVRHYTSQIARAKRLGKTEFDRDKFKGDE